MLAACHETRALTPAQPGLPKHFSCLFVVGEMKKLNCLLSSFISDFGKPMARTQTRTAAHSLYNTSYLLPLEEALSNGAALQKLKAAAPSIRMRVDLA